jgi:hypothetical protein
MTLTVRETGTRDHKLVRRRWVGNAQSKQLISQRESSEWDDVSQRWSAQTQVEQEDKSSRCYETPLGMVRVVVGINF